MLHILSIKMIPTCWRSGITFSSSSTANQMALFALCLLSISTQEWVSSGSSQSSKTEDRTTTQTCLNLSLSASRSSPVRGRMLESSVRRMRMMWTWRTASSQTTYGRSLSRLQMEGCPTTLDAGTFCGGFCDVVPATLGGGGAENQLFRRPAACKGCNFIKQLFL